MGSGGGESLPGVLKAFYARKSLYKKRSMGEKVCFGVMTGGGDSGQFWGPVWLDLQGQSCPGSPPFPSSPVPGGKVGGYGVVGGHLL